MAGAEAAPGVSKSPGGRMIVCPLGPTYETAASPFWPSVITRENSAGSQRAGSYTWSTATAAFTALTAQTIVSSRITCPVVRTRPGIQKTGASTAR